MSRREELKARLEERKRKRRRRWAWRIALLLALILLLLISRCTCYEEPVPDPGVGAPPVPVEVEPEPPSEPLPRHPKVQRIDRPELPEQPLAPLPWLSSFKLQVSARSPRLADCFVGAERPGRLRWKAAVDPVRGQVSQQTLEPVSAWDTLSADQRECVLGILQEPAYTLDPGDGPSTPSTLTMVIEF